ncbi:hypothetical protein ACQJBY_070949 [Aegilops geniculata]
MQNPPSPRRRHAPLRSSPPMQNPLVPLVATTHPSDPCRHPPPPPPLLSPRPPRPRPTSPPDRPTPRRWPTPRDPEGYEMSDVQGARHLLRHAMELTTTGGDLLLPVHGGVHLPFKLQLTDEGHFLLSAHTEELQQPWIRPLVLLISAEGRRAFQVKCPAMSHDDYAVMLLFFLDHLNHHAGGLLKHQLQ